MKKLLLVLLVLGSNLRVAATAMASGSYSGRPPFRITAVDTSKYHLGKKIFTGKVSLRGASDAVLSEQRQRLQEIQDKLPANVQKAVNVLLLAGRLTAEQMQALVYYISVRYKVK